MAETTVEIVLKAKDEISKIVKTIRASFKNLKDELDSVSKEGLDTASLDTFAEHADELAAGFAEGFKEAINEVQREVKELSGLNVVPTGLEKIDDEAKKAASEINLLNTQLRETGTTRPTVLLNSLKEMKTRADAAIRSFRELQDKFQDISTAGRELLKLAAAPAIFGGIALKNAADFSKQVAEIASIVPDADRNIEQLRQDVLDLSNEFGVNKTDTAKALYEAISAGAKAGTDANKLLGVAIQAGIGGVTTTETAVDALTTVINSYGLSADDAGKVSDQLFVAVRNGKTTFEELARSLFQVVPLAASMGVGFDQVAATLATATLQGTRTSEATTQMRAALVGIARPTDELTKIFAEFGGASAFIRENGLAAALQKVRDAVGGDVGALQTMLGSVEAVSNALQTTGDKSDLFARSLNDVQTELGVTRAAAEEVNQSLGRKFESAVARISNSFEALGNALAPVAGDVADAISGIATALAKLINDFPNATAVVAGTIGVLTVFAATAGAVLLAVGALAPALITGFRVFKTFGGGIGSVISLLGGFSTTAGVATKSAGFLSAALGTLATALSGKSVGTFFGKLISTFSTATTGVSLLTAATTKFGTAGKGAITVLGRFSGLLVIIGQRLAGVLLSLSPLTLGLTALGVAGGFIAEKFLAVRNQMAAAEEQGVSLAENMKKVLDLREQATASGASKDFLSRTLSFQKEVSTGKVSDADFNAQFSSFEKELKQVQELKKAKIAAEIEVSQLRSQQEIQLQKQRKQFQEELLKGQIQGQKDLIAQQKTDITELERLRKESEQRLLRFKEENLKIGQTIERSFLETDVQAAPTQEDADEIRRVNALEKIRDIRSDILTSTSLEKTEAAQLAIADELSSVNQIEDLQTRIDLLSELKSLQEAADAQGTLQGGREAVAQKDALEEASLKLSEYEEKLKTLEVQLEKFKDPPPVQLDASIELAQDKLNQIEAQLEQLTQPRVIPVTVQDNTESGGEGEVRRATGGDIPGYGGGDKVKALLEPGEFVVRKERAKMFKSLLNKINFGSASTVRQKFKTGGNVSENSFSKSSIRRASEIQHYNTGGEVDKSKKTVLRSFSDVVKRFRDGGSVAINVNKNYRKKISDVVQHFKTGGEVSELVKTHTKGGISEIVQKFKSGGEVGHIRMPAFRLPDVSVSLPRADRVMKFATGGPVPSSNEVKSTPINLTLPGMGTFELQGTPDTAEKLKRVLAREHLKAGR